MFETIFLQAVDPHRPLILISDPDNVLQDEALLASLANQGYTVVRESDPVALRHEMQRARMQAGQRIVVITKHELERLPYDLWQQGQHITLALHELFPRLDPYHVSLLRGPARRRLAEAYQARPPARHLSPVETEDYLLREVFDAAPERLDRPASLLLWLDGFHKTAEPMGIGLLQRLLAHLQENPAFAGWPLWGMLLSGENYREFVRNAWQREVGHFLGEERVGYETLPFADDEALQDALPRLVRTGTVEPVAVDRSVSLPAWAAPALAVDAAAVRRRQLDEAMEAIADDLQPAELRWEQWQAIARRWAQLSLWRYDYDYGVTPAQSQRLAGLDATLDGRFTAWLQTNYTPLAGIALPRPHHLYHALSYVRSIAQHIHQRVALLVLDGMSLADWTLIRPAWQMRHHEWEISEHLVLAQVPSVTSVSRQALISGLRPARLVDTLVTTQQEGRRWREFWQASTDMAPERFLYGALDERFDTPLLADILSQRTVAACFVSTAIDNMLHGATQGSADMQASLRLWLADGAARLEALIERLLEEQMLVVLASDHGHVEAVGMGRPQEGVLVESRSQRARLYTNADFAHTVQVQYPETILWSDNLLPAGWQALMPSGRQAFTPQGTRVVSHGGLTIDEMIVPLVYIER
jgi:hypothetical protein